MSEQTVSRLGVIHRKFDWEIAADGETWYVLDKVMRSVEKNTIHYMTDLLYDVARLAPLMISNEKPQKRLVAVFGVRTMGIDGTDMVFHRLDDWDVHYNALFLLEEDDNGYGGRMFRLWKMVCEADE
jgi:hypothetical protein